MPKFKRARHLGKRSLEALTRELESLLNQYSPNTLTIKELTQFKKVYYEITDDFLKYTTPYNLEMNLKGIETKFKMVDPNFQLPAFTRD